MTDDRLPLWARGLGLQPHPEGGWYAETWRSELTLAAEALGDRYTDARAAGTAIYFLLLPGEESAWHTVVGAELWLHHRGAPVELDLGRVGERPDGVHTVRVGPDLDAGERPQAIVPPGVWQRARVAPPASGTVDGGADLVSCVVVPGFDFADFGLLGEQ